MKSKVIKLFAFPILFLVLGSNLIAQNNYPKAPIAILDFDGNGISEQALVALTNQFRGNIVELNSFTVLDRGKMSAILQEQGFQLSGCSSSECAVEAGRILNVRKMVSGNIGKVGATYTVNISLIDVESSRIEKSFNRTYSGKVDGLINTFKEIAYSMSGKSIKEKTKASLYIFGSTALASIGFGTYSYFESKKSYKNYQDAKTVNKMLEYKNDTEKYNDYILYSSIATGSSIIFYFVFDGLFNSGIDDNAISANFFKSNYDTYNLALTIKF